MRKLITVLVLSAVMAMTAQAETMTRYVSSDNGVRLRSGHSTEAEIQMVIPYGEAVTEEEQILAEDRTWSAVRYGDLAGYICSDYLADENPLNGATYMGTWRITAYAYTGSACANGAYPTTGHTIAQNNLPFGTKVYIGGVGVRVIEDRGPGWLGNEWCDLYLGDTGECIQWGNQCRDVYLLGD
ncbi:MAG: hypothetical protein IKM88_05385 [Lachnospiraceae bacterium]|nr:hypothetical protein [Lachnospiraceae bacterium]